MKTFLINNGGTKEEVSQVDSFLNSPENKSEIKKVLSKEYVKVFDSDRLDDDLALDLKRLFKKGDPKVAEVKTTLAGLGWDSNKIEKSLKGVTGQTVEEILRKALQNGGR